MAPVSQEPEIILAQRLASNEKHIRTKALKTLRKYINLRSQKIEGGFTNEDLLKIWKGLFYCLWMQDKPLQQEEISHKISGLIHSFHTTDTQLLYFTTFLQTVKREWNGIDNLRMDKFYQLVRFVFRQTFVALRRREWEASVVNEFLRLFTEQLLQNTENVPKGLVMHVLDLYMTELAQVGSTELTAEQNLNFIDPFCKTMAKTKDDVLLAFISKNIFKTVLDLAPFAIEDLIRELQQGGFVGSDSGQASGEEEEEEIEEEEELKNKVPKKTKVKKVNGISEVVKNSKRSKKKRDLYKDDGIGPVLQFDYGAVADRLFELGSRLNTPNINRKKMYSFVNAFRTLNGGIFDGKKDDDGEVSNTSNNKMLKKKSKKKRKNPRPTAENEPVTKKSKAACQDEQKPSNSVQNGSLNSTSGDYSQHHHKLDSRQKTSEIEACAETVCEHKEADSQDKLEAGVSVIKKKRKSKKLKTVSQDVGGEVKTDTESNRQVVEKCDPGEFEASTVEKKRRRSKKLCSSLQEVGEVEVQRLPKEDSPGDEVKPQKEDSDSNETQSQLETKTIQTKKVKRKKVGVEFKSLSVLEDSEISIPPCPTAEEGSVTQCGLKASTTKKKKGKSKKLMAHGSSSNEVGSTSQDSGAVVVTKAIAAPADDVPCTEAQSSEALLGQKSKKSKKKKATEDTGSKHQVDLEVREPEVSADSTHITATTTPINNTDECPQTKVRKAKKKKQPSSNEESTLEAKEQPTSTKQTHTTCKKKKIQKKQESQPADEAREESVLTVKEKTGTEASDTLDMMKSFTPMKKGKKKRKLGTDEAEMSQSNGPAQENLSGKKVKVSDIEVSTSVTPKKLKMEKPTPKSNFISFQGLLKPPTPLFCKTKPKGSTPLSSIKQKFQTPKSETKKVTFGLKNNKTTEFRKTDRSLSVSPVGSSRVAFDPKKMPMSGVLKSPSQSPVTSVKKTAAKKRATAADFF